MDPVNRNINPPLPTEYINAQPPVPVFTDETKAEKPHSGTFGKVLKIVGAITLVIIVIFSVFILISIRNYSKYQKESKIYVDTEVQKIVDDWNEEELLAQADEQFLSATPKKSIDELFLYFSKNLGSFIQYENSTLIDSRSYSGTTGNIIVAVYSSDARFERGTAQIITTVQNKNGKWTILGFRVNSQAFLKK